MPSVVFDNFTAADGTALENHTPNTGSGAWDVSVRTDWGDVIGPATDNMLIAGNQLVQAQPANTHIRALIDAGSANSTVEVDVTPPEGVFAMALLGQASTTTAGGWILHIGYVSFLRDSAGNNTYFSHSYTAGETYGLSMTFDNGAVTARINGEVVATMTGSNGPDTYAGLASHVDSVYSAAAFDNFTVSEINDAPVAYDTTLDVPHDQLATLDIGWYSVYDADGDTVQLIIVDQAEHGEASANADGTVTFTPEANWTGTTSFTIQGNDGSADSNVASLDFHSTTVA